jgi:hypothetical protein
MGLNRIMMLMAQQNGNDKRPSHLVAYGAKQKSNVQYVAWLIDTLWN